MPRYRITTPDTPRVPGRAYSDFEQGLQCATPVGVRHYLSQHGFIGCTVHRLIGKHWTIEFDSTWHNDSIAAAAAWRRTEEAQ